MPPTSRTHCPALARSYDAIFANGVILTLLFVVLLYIIDYLPR